MKHSLSIRSRNNPFQALTTWLHSCFPKAECFQNSHILGEHFLILIFKNCKTGKKSFTGKVSTHSPDLHKANWGTEQVPTKTTEIKTPHCMHCKCCAYSYSLLCIKSHVYHVPRRGSAAERPPPGNWRPPGCAYQAEPQGRCTLPRGKPCCSSPSPCICLHLESHLGSVVDQGSTGGLWAPLRTQQELELPILPCLLQKQQQWPSSPRQGRRVQQLLLLQGWLGGQSGTQKPRFSPCSCCG